MNGGDEKICESLNDGDEKICESLNDDGDGKNDDGSCPKIHPNGVCSHCCIFLNYFVSSSEINTPFTKYL